jgi:hypothetical protein
VVGTHRGLATVSHGGSWGGYRAELLRFPQQKFSVVCQCNLGSTNPSRLARQVAEVYLGELMKPAGGQAGSMLASGGYVPPSGPELQKYTGLFRNRENGGLRRISLHEGKLRIDSFGPNSTEIRPIQDNTFAVAGTFFSTRIKFEDSGNVMVVHRATDLPETERFERAEAFAPTAAELAAYAGTYYSEELDATYVLSVKDGKLWTRIGFNPPGELRPAVRDVFVGPFGIRVEFARDAQGRASFAVQAGRVRNIRFVRR